MIVFICFFFFNFRSHIKEWTYAICISVSQWNFQTIASVKVSLLLNFHQSNKNKTLFYLTHCFSSMFALIHLLNTCAKLAWNIHILQGTCWRMNTNLGIIISNNGMFCGKKHNHRHWNKCNKKSSNHTIPPQNLEPRSWFQLDWWNKNVILPQLFLFLPYIRF